MEAKGSFHFIIQMTFTFSCFREFMRLSPIFPQTEFLGASNSPTRPLMPLPLDVCLFSPLLLFGMLCHLFLHHDSMLSSMARYRHCTFMSIKVTGNRSLPLTEQKSGAHRLVKNGGTQFKICVPHPLPTRVNACSVHY